ncbi:hypothetical protein GGF39_001394 [Coemansia sp. RSA 1721]|nr:hypothetical protein GGF39_001394 [Coemansia sp. RSA 1721]
MNAQDAQLQLQQQLQLHQQQQQQQRLHQQHQLQLQFQNQLQQSAYPNGENGQVVASAPQLVVEAQYHAVGSLLQGLGRLEQTGDKFFESLAMVGQGPPSLLAAQLVAMSQICQQMQDTTKNTAMLNIPVATADPVFIENADVLPRDKSYQSVSLGSAGELEAWVQETAKQTGDLFAERRRVAANVKAALSVPPPKPLSL